MNKNTYKLWDREVKKFADKLYKKLEEGERKSERRNKRKWDKLDESLENDFIDEDDKW